MGKALVTEEGVGRMLDPDFDMVSMAEPYVEQLLRQRYDTHRQLAKWLEILDGYQRMLARLPADVQMALAGLGRTSAARGEERSRDRLSLAIVASALFLGASLILQSGTGPKLWGMPVLGLLGYVGAAVLVGWLLWGLRSGRG